MAVGWHTLCSGLSFFVVHSCALRVLGRGRHGSNFVKRGIRTEYNNIWNDVRQKTEKV